MISPGNLFLFLVLLSLGFCCRLAHVVTTLRQKLRYFLVAVVL